MQARRKVLILGVTSVAAMSMLVVSQHAFAAGTGTPMSGLVSAIATKFNLKPADVQAVVDQYQQDEQATRAQKETDRLNQAVTDGKLTAAQRDLIVAKQKEMQASMDQIRGLSNDADRKAAMDKLQTDLKTWSQQNNIDMNWLRPHRGGGGRPGWQPTDKSSTPAT